MCKFARYLILCWLAMGSLACAMSSAADDEGEHLRTVLLKLVPDSLKISIKRGDVSFKGKRDDLDRVVSVFRDYDAVRKVLQQANSDCLGTQSSREALSSWESFLKWTGVNESDYAMYNSSALHIADKDGRWTVKTSSNVSKRLTATYLSALSEDVPFFRWAQTNIPEFMTVTNEMTVVNYGLLGKFLHLDDAEIYEDEGECVARWPVQDMLKVMVAAASGAVSLTKVSENPEAYRVNVIDLGGIKPEKSGVLHIYLDVSSSMDLKDLSGSGTSRLAVVKAALPSIFQDITADLREDQQLTVRVTPFNHELQPTQSFTLTRGGLTNGTFSAFLSHLSPDGKTDLRNPVRSVLTRASMEVQPEHLAILMTDGEHQPWLDYNKSELKKQVADLLKEVEAHLLTSGKSFQLLTVQVGQESEDFFGKFAQIMGTPTYCDKSMKDFIAALRGRIRELMMPRSGVLLHLLHQNEVRIGGWISSVRPSFTTLRDTVTTGDEVTFKEQMIVVRGGLNLNAEDIVPLR